MHYLFIQTGVLADVQIIRLCRYLDRKSRKPVLPHASQLKIFGENIWLFSIGCLMKGWWTTVNFPQYFYVRYSIHGKYIVDGVFRDFSRVVAKTDWYRKGGRRQSPLAREVVFLLYFLLMHFNV